jgi:molybdate transport system substrate-binding protein
MQDVLAEIKQLYLIKHPQANITFNFGSSGSLQNQIEQGAPIDIFISAAPEQMDNLAAKKLLLEETRQDLVKNQMVLITSPNNQLIDDFSDLTKKSTEQVALGEPNSVPAGKYAQEILTNLKLIDDIQAKAVYGKDVRQVLNYVATGNIEAGIVYRSDTTTNKTVKVVATAPEITHSPVVYPVAIVKDSYHPQAAKQMLEFLLSDETKEIFIRYGFTPINRQNNL